MDENAKLEPAATPPAEETPTTPSAIPPMAPESPPSDTANPTGPVTQDPSAFSAPNAHDLLNGPGPLIGIAAFPTQPFKVKPKPDTFRELLETVVFVLVLVLVLKSFVAEAFVIPTGSMAETLFGYQKKITCPTCGHLFYVNSSSEVEQMPGQGVVPVTSCTCPNCLQHVRLLRGDDQGLPDEATLRDPGPSTGDRVLVAKYLYEIPQGGPNRHDVVVFKYPGNSNPNEFNFNSPRFPDSGPQRNHTAFNYIKRLVGMSGETIAIRAGDLYSMPEGTVPPPASKAEKPEDLWMWENMHENQARELFLQGGKFEIIQKDPSTILAMARIVYDDNHRPKDLPRLKRWQMNKPVWQESNPANFRLDSSEKQTAWLRYNHLLRNNDGRRQLITDVLGYNTAHHELHRPGYGDNWVSDLILEANCVVEKAQGELIMELSAGADRFRAVWNLESGHCALKQIRQGVETALATATNHPLKPGSRHLRFANVDQRLTVWQDGKLLFKNGTNYQRSKETGPTLANDLEPASLGGSNTAFSLTNLRLYRDSYYTARLNPSTPDVSVGDWTEQPNARPGQEIPDTWKGLSNPPVKTLYVQPGHYLCLGDNSPQSSDGRSWGLVPKRLLMGRAVAIYFPPGRIGAIP